MAIDLRNRLNPQQLEAVEATEGPILILAGAGSGKTRVITYRVVHLVENLGVRPESILAVTFTNKAADQMKFRIRHMLRVGRGGDPLISTFHSLCVRILRREIEALGYSRDFSICDETDQLQVIKAAMRDLRVEDRTLTAKTIQGRITYAKNHGKSPEQMEENAWDPKWEMTAAVFREYEKKLRAANALDFDDLLIRTVEVFDQFPAAAEKYSRRFHYMKVDEYQDTNRMQYYLVRHLTRLHENICVVGDEDQSIYSWRGADIQNILSFEKDYPQARIIKLEQNYRSTKNILAAASSVVAHNEARKGKTLWTENITGERITSFEATDGDEEAAFVADRVLDHQKREPEVRVAVLYRTNFLSRVLEETLRRSNTSYHIVGGFSFYERAEVKDMIGYLAVALNPNDSIHLLRIINTPVRGIGKTTIDALEELAIRRGISIWEAMGVALQEGLLPLRTLRTLESFQRMISEFREAAEQQPAAMLLEKILGATKYIEKLQEERTEEADSRIENLRELLTAAQESDERGERLRDFLDHAALVSEQDAYDEKAPVSLMTLHTAKGLEFSVVFIVGLEEGLFPHSRSMLEQSDLEEERRLCYVGMTRAEHKLYLTSARYRRYFGNLEQQVSEISRFVSEIQPELIEDFYPAKQPAAAYQGTTYNTAGAVREFLKSNEKTVRKESAKKPSLVWSLGTRVKHPKYGYGTVLRAEGSGDDLKLTISFLSHGLKKVLAKYADLESA